MQTIQNITNEKYNLKGDLLKGEIKMIKVNKDKYKMGLVNKLIKNIDEGIYANDVIINKLKEIEHDDREINNAKDRVIDLYITAIEKFKIEKPIMWVCEPIYTKRALWKKLNEIGIYYTVPLWKLDKTVEEIIQTRKTIKHLADKERQLINKIKGGEQ